MEPRQPLNGAQRRLLKITARMPLASAANLNQSQGGMCICRVMGIGSGVSRECFGP